MSRVIPLASARFDHVLLEAERAAVARALVSAGAKAHSWARAGTRTYALLQLPSEHSHDALAAAAFGARIDAPPLAVLAVHPAHPARLVALSRALAGRGRPVGIVDAFAWDGAVVVEVDTNRTPLATIVDLLDVELAPAPGRSIVPLLALTDDTVASLAASVLQTAELDAARILERHLRPALRALTLEAGS